MKRMVKKIVLLSVAILCCVAVVWGGAWCSAQRDSSPCAEVQIVVKDSLERQFVDADELASYLRRHRLYPLGLSMESVDCHAIECCLQGHEMVRKVECYKSSFGTVCVDVTQRVPVLSVVANDGSYYVDSDRRVMPVRKQIDVDVTVFRGVVGPRAATEEYYDFVLWLRDNHYLCSYGERFNQPYQQYIEQGLFTMKQNVFSVDGEMRTRNTTKVTGKGQIYFINKFIGQS